jgi:hypothetical protein
MVILRFAQLLNECCVFKNCWSLTSRIETNLKDFEGRIDEQ